MRTSSCRYAQVDVFTSKAGMGNPLGVVFDADGWSSARMQRLAAWLNLVETTFVLAPSRNDASYRLRIFTPSREIPFAGHPSIGSAYAALRLGFCTATGGELRQECAAGLLPLRVEGDPRQPLLSIASPPARIEADADPGPALALLAGLPPGTRPPALVSGGRRWWIAEVGDEAALRAWTPPVAHIRRLAEATDSLGLCLFARSASPAYQIAVRAFPCAIGIDEDPASGTANALLAAYLQQCEPQGPLARGYIANQGRELGRDAWLHLRSDATATWVGGHCVLVLHGRLEWPDHDDDRGDAIR